MVDQPAYPYLDIAPITSELRIDHLDCELVYVHHLPFIQRTIKWSLSPVYGALFLLPEGLSSGNCLWISACRRGKNLQ